MTTHTTFVEYDRGGTSLEEAERGLWFASMYALARRYCTIAHIICLFMGVMQKDELARFAEDIRSDVCMDPTLTISLITVVLFH
jgi:hypothetical protein